MVKRLDRDIVEAQRLQLFRRPRPCPGLCLAASKARADIGGQPRHDVPRDIVLRRFRLRGNEGNEGGGERERAELVSHETSPIFGVLSCQHPIRQNARLPGPSRLARGRIKCRVRTPFHQGTIMAAQYAYVMKDMTKTFPGAQKPVLNNINLQFYQGAKIGIVGPNGAGKSTLIKIMAGIDKDFTGEAWPGENITVGYLEQEPQLDESKTVLENVKDGARDGGHGRALQPDRHGMAEEDADFDAWARRWPSFRTRSTRSMAGRSTTSSKSRWKRCAARPATGRWQAWAVKSAASR
jgi:hypothetical protein